MGTTLAWVWGDDGEVVPCDRTESTDLAFGLRQLQDVATRALSPGLNDPTTATLAVTQMSAVLCRYSSHPLGDDVLDDDDGSVRIAVPRPGFEALLELAVGATRRYGRNDPEVIAALLTMLTDVAEHVSDSGDRREVVREQVRRVVDGADLADPVDRQRIARVEALAQRTLERGSRVATQTEAS